MSRIILATVSSAISLFFCGCSEGPPPIVPVEGVLLLNNEPLPHAKVRFAPNLHGPGGDFLAEGITDENGRFQLTCKGQPGACACENMVIVVEGPMIPEGRGPSGAAQAAADRFLASMKNRPIPKEYGMASKTPLSVNVVQGQTEYKLELRR
jgi:hypothetical protein